MLVLGIDPGTAITGYGLVRETDSGDLSVVDFGVIRTSSKKAMPRRLLEIYRTLGDIISEYQPDSSAVEKLFFQRNVSTAISVGQSRGAVLVALAEADVPIAEYNPMEIKQAVSGYGGADKHQMQKMIQALLGLEQIPQPDDAADALAVAVCHLHSYRMNRLIE